MPKAPRSLFRLSHPLVLAAIGAAVLGALTLGVTALRSGGASTQAADASSSGVVQPGQDGDALREGAEQALPKLVEHLHKVVAEGDPWRPVWLARALGPGIHPRARRALAALSPAQLTPTTPGLYAGAVSSLLRLAKVEAGLEVELPSAWPHSAQDVLSQGLELDLHGLILARAPQPTRRRTVSRLAAAAHSTLRLRSRGRQFDSRDAVLATALFRTLSVLPTVSTQNAAHPPGARIFHGVARAQPSAQTSERLNEVLVLEALAARVHATTAPPALKEVVARGLRRVLRRELTHAHDRSAVELTHIIRAVRYAKATL